MFGKFIVLALVQAVIIGTVIGAGVVGILILGGW